MKAKPMMYDELIKRLRECTAEQNGEKTLWHQAADAIEELQRQIKPTLNHCGIQGSCRDSRHQENKNMMTQDELDVWVNELLEQKNDS